MGVSPSSASAVPWSDGWWRISMAGAVVQCSAISGWPMVAGGKGVPVPGITEIWWVISGAMDGLRRGSWPPANFSCLELVGGALLLHRGLFWGKRWDLAASNQSSASVGFSNGGGAISDVGAAALEVGDVLVLGRLRGSGVGKQTWPLGRHGCRWLSERGCIGGVRATGFITCPVLGLADGGGDCGRRFLLAGSVVVLPLPSDYSG